jgi:hypothetical protein
MWPSNSKGGDPMRMMAMLLLALVFSQVCYAGDEAQISRKSREKWGVELAIDSLEIKNPIITKDLVRAIGWYESGWNQDKNDGRTNMQAEPNGSYSIGIMGINDAKKSRYVNIDYLLVKTNPVYNVQVGLEILEEKFKHIKKIRRLYHIGKSHGDVEIGLCLYNGFVPGNWRYANEVKRIERLKPWKRF